MGPHRYRPKIPTGWFTGRAGGLRGPLRIPRVLNIRHGAVNISNSVNIMRPGPFGNRFRQGWEGDRATVVRLHRQALLSDYDLLGKVARLRGYDLVCCCKPKACHGDIYFVLSNTDPDIGEELWRI